MRSTRESDAQLGYTDAPIVNRTDDAFSRGELASRLARELTGSAQHPGRVVALCGPWGSGKTSIADLAFDELPESTIQLKFNPWLFSGVDDLTGRFLSELAIELTRHDDRGKKAARTLARYGSTVSGGISRFAGKASKVAKYAPGGATASNWLDVLSTISESNKKTPNVESVQTQRDRVVSSLRELNRPIVVLIDDVDRLADEEVFAVVKLVKLVGELPGITYLLCFDRERVEQVLGGSGNTNEQRARGRSYLEKIVQFRYDVPPPRPRDLLAYFMDALHARVGDSLSLPTTRNEWRLLQLAIQDLLRTPRDAVRICAGVPTALDLHGTDVAHIDLLGLEVLRVLEPDLHASIPVPEMLELLLYGGRYVSLDSHDENSARRTEEIESLLKKASSPTGVRNLLAVLFPDAQPELGGTPRTKRTKEQELRECRVANEAVFRRYFHSTTDLSALSGRESQRLDSALSGETLLPDFFRSIRQVQFLDAFDRIVSFPDEIPAERALTLARDLLALTPRLDTAQKRIAGGLFSGSEHFRSALEALLLAPREPAASSQVANRLFEDSENLSDKLRVATWFGTLNNQASPGVIPFEETQQLINQVSNGVRGSSSALLCDEPEAVLLLARLNDAGNPNSRFEIESKLEHDPLLLHVLQDLCVHHRISQGPYAQTSEWVLEEIDVLGLMSRSFLRRRIEQLQSYAAEEPRTDRENAAVEQAVRIATTHGSENS